MGLTISASSVFRPQRFTCYMVGKGKRCCSEEENYKPNKCEDKKTKALNKLKNLYCQGEAVIETRSKCSTFSPVSPSQSGNGSLPLSKVLNNLKEATSFSKKCSNKISDLMQSQRELIAQIEHLENREKEGVQLVKQTVCMWSCMENVYQKRIAESLKKQMGLIKQLKDVEISNAKWRKNKRNFEIQMTSINKCQKEITEKLDQKNNDIKCMDMEITDTKNRVENLKNATNIAKKSLSHKKQASDIKIASISEEVTRLQKLLGEENKYKYKKVQDGNKFMKDSRDDLQKLCVVLTLKKLKSEEIKLQKEAVLQEMDLLQQAMDLYKDWHKNKQVSILDDIKKVDSEIAAFKIKCIRCHQFTDTIDVRKFCTDCPKCLEDRKCMYEDGNCSPDSTIDCVCMSVKQKFLRNVFENMYTVLVQQIKTGPGKAVANAILSCLKRSRNGKLNYETKQILQDFILNTVKKNFNLAIIGGAAKTRCEMDPETYKELMLRLKQVKVVKPPKVDKGTMTKKESCRRWDGTSECNCPSGPKPCICTKCVPAAPSGPAPCPPIKDKVDDPGELAICPHKESTACGPDCAMHAVAHSIGGDMAQWRRDPCLDLTCPFTISIKAGECRLGNESLSSVPKSFMPNVPNVPYIPVLENLLTAHMEIIYPYMANH